MSVPKKQTWLSLVREACNILISTEISLSFSAPGELPLMYLVIHLRRLTQSASCNATFYDRKVAPIIALAIIGL
jgi:hypothetical protein